MTQIFDRSKEPGFAAAAVAPPPLRLRLAGELVKQPTPTEWLLTGWLERGACAMLIGAPASGKSFIALSVAACIATGHPWFGRRVRRGGVVYLCGEGHRGVQRRLYAWSDHHGVSLADAPLWVSDRAFPLNQAVDAHDAETVIAAAVAERGETPELIVVDTTARHFGGDENSAQEAGALLANAIALGQRWRAALLLVHHSGHAAADRARGSSAFRGAVDCEYLAKREGEGGRVQLRCMKIKDGDEPEPMAFDLLGYALPWNRDDGTPDSSAILQHVPGAVPAQCEPQASKGPGGANQRRALEVLRAMLDEQRRTLAAAGHDPRQACVATDGWRDRCGFDRSRWREVLQGLIERGLVRRDPPHVVLVGSDE